MLRTRERVYPTPGPRSPQSASRTPQALEHTIFQTALLILSGARQFGAKAKVLKDLIEHHAGEEETEMFPKARTALGPAKLLELGKHIQDRKEELQSGLLTRAARTAGAALGTVMKKVGTKKRAA